MKCIKYFLFILSFLKFSFGANILYIQSVAYYGHQLTHHQLIKSLASKGHNLTVFSTHFMDFNDSNISQDVFGRTPKSKIVESKLNEMSRFEYFVDHEMRYHYEATKTQFENLKLQKLFRNSEQNKFDLLIVECNFCAYLVLAEIYDCPVVQFYSTDLINFLHESTGNYVHDTIHPELLIPTIHGKLNLIERVVSFVHQNFFSNIFKARIIRLSRDLFHTKFPNISLPSLFDISGKRMRLFMSDTSALTANIRPIVPNYHQIAFMHIEPPKPIENKEVERFLNDSISGVIVVSFGSIAKDFPDFLFTKFYEIFKDLPVNVVWKANRDKYKHLDISKNILISEWLQLTDILAHPNVKVLIGHGGLKTVEEAIDREVPMVLMPLNLDQPFNTFFQMKNEIAVHLDLNKFTKASLKAAIAEVLRPQYKENIRKIRSLAYDKMSTSLDEAVENIEYLIKHNEVFEFQAYEGRRKADHSELFYDIFWMIGRFLIFLLHVVNYFF